MPNNRNTCTRAVPAHCKVSWSLRKWFFLNACTCYQSRRLLQTCRMNCSCVDTTCARSIVIVMPSPRGSDSSLVFRWICKANVSLTQVFAIFLEVTRLQKLDENTNWMSWVYHTCLVFWLRKYQFAKGWRYFCLVAETRTVLGSVTVGACHALQPPSQSKESA